MTTTQTRRPATAADAKIGTTVYKGKGKVAYRVYAINPESAPGFPQVGICKATSKTPTGQPWYFHISNLTIED